MSETASLTARISRRETRIAVVGLGYVGLPVAASFAAAGFEVLGLDTHATRVDDLNAGRLPLAISEPGLSQLVTETIASRRLRATCNISEVAGAEIGIVAVDTPLGPNHQPDWTQLIAACENLATNGDPHLVVIESTLAPGTMRMVVAPRFDPTIALVHCPERVRPGRLLRNLREMDRLVGVADPPAGTAATALYATIVQAELIVTDWETAEVIKTAENAARDVQIALANQLAVISDHAGVDYRRVRDQINRLWESEPLVMEAGGGVGGHCLPKDPWLLVSGLPEDASTALVRGARELNNSMPAHTARIVIRALEQAGLNLSKAEVTVLGLTYDANSDDERNAAGPQIALRLASRGVRVRTHDPYVTPNTQIDGALAGADAAVLVVPHRTYCDADWGALGGRMRHRILIDCRRKLDSGLLTALGFTVRALGVAALR